MYIKIKVHPNSKADKILRKNEDTFEIFVRAKAIDGKANEACLKLLAESLSVPRSRIHLIRGTLSHNKLIELLE